MNSLTKTAILFTLVLTVCFTGCKDSEPEETTGLSRDIDGNVYDTVRIGNQVWMKQNLRVTRLNDGTPLINPVSDADWIANERNKKAAYCWNKNDTSLKKTYGALYNEYAVASGKLAPKGWRIPNKADWDTLLNYLQTHSYNFRETVNSQLDKDWNAKALSDSLYWEPYTGKGSVGFEKWKNNNTGFSAVPTCTRGSTGTFSYLGYYTYFWTLSTPGITPVTFEQQFSSCAYIDHIGVRMTFNNWYANTGHSVRCIRIK